MLIKQTWVAIWFTFTTVGLTTYAHDLRIHPDATAIAHINAVGERETSGMIQFIPTDTGVRVVVHIMNLPRGRHGIHIHESGDLSAPDLSSAGGHFNPTNEKHGGPDSAERHVGDLGNLLGNSINVANLEYVDRRIRLDGPMSIIGKAVIIHEQPDDLESQPSGNAGARIAGGVIERRK